MVKDATKVYSTKQEHMIADLLGWSTVSASGARNFHPGDITSKSFLGECKTHVSETEKIKFVQDEWNKISLEAIAEHKIPVLFTDDGTQSITNTWVMFPKYSIGAKVKWFEVNQDNHPNFNKLFHIRKNIIFSNIDLRYEYKKIKRVNLESGIDSTIVFTVNDFGVYPIFICPLTEFAELQLR